jgi:Ni,Fe-hydrogenase I cytochrome b subunit
MNGRNRAPAYTTARLLHWITALSILAMILLGVVIANEWGSAGLSSRATMAARQTIAAMDLFITPTNDLRITTGDPAD